MPLAFELELGGEAAHDPALLRVAPSGQCFGHHQNEFVLPPDARPDRLADASSSRLAASTQHAIADLVTETVVGIP